MKKILIIIGILLVFTILVFQSGCDKTVIQDPIVAENSNNQITQIIKNFHEIVTSNNKGSNSLPVDSVEWLTEADINYNYCIVDKRYLLSVKDSFMVNTPVDANNMISSDDYSKLYKEMIDSLTVFWNSVDDETKYMVIVDVDFYEISGNKALFNVYSYIGYGIGNFTPPDFGDTDYWYFGNTGGKCGPYSGYTNTGAATLIEQKIRWEQPLQANSYYINNYNVEKHAWDLTPICGTQSNPCDNYTDYRLFYETVYPGSPPQGYVQGDWCLDPYEMNFHHDGTKWLYNHYNNDPSTIDNAAVNVTAVVVGYTYLHPSHVAHYWYGNPMFDLTRTILTF